MISESRHREFEHVPFVVFKVKPQSDEGIRLSGHAANREFLELFGLKNVKNLRRNGAESVLECYRIQVDEWIEFTLKACKMPSLLDARRAERDGAMRKRFMQRFRDHGGWMLVDIAYRADFSYLCLRFQPPNAKTVSIDADQLIEMKQLQRLGDFTAGGGGREAGGRWEIDYTSGNVFISRELAQTLGIASNALVIPLAAFLDSVHYRDLQTMLKMVDNTADESGPLVIRNRLPGGRTIYLRSYARPLSNQSGEVARIIGNSQDVTESVIARERLFHSEDKFRRIVENSSELFFIVDRYGRYQYVSPNIESILGLRVADVEGQLFGMYLECNEDARLVRRKFSEVMESKQPGWIQYRIKDASGRVLWYVSSISVVLDEEGEPAEAIVIGRDFTDERIRQDKFNYVATHDLLTGALNRFCFEQELNRIEREEVVDFCMIMIDINGLRLINDAFGHRKGDEVLTAVAEILEGIPRVGKLFRVGGDEFMIVLYDSDLIDGESVAEQISGICQGRIVRDVSFSVSYGVVCRKKSDVSAASLYQLAESRLYNNKLNVCDSVHNQVISSLSEAMKQRNLETAEHVQRVERMVVALDKRLKLSNDAFNRMVLLASMHDIGKLAIPDGIINKPGKLTEDEWAVMRTHCEVGYRIAMASSGLSEIAREILYHHERWDGAGYPQRKKGEEIPLLSRILSVVDTYDVITHKRVYKDPCSHEMAIEEIKRCSGTQFDPTIVSMFLEIFEDMPGDETFSLADDQKSIPFQPGAVNFERFAP